MSRYFTRPRQAKADREMNDWQGFPLVPNLEVSDHEAADTGLVDKRGDPIMRAPNPIGFGSDL